MEKPLTIVMYHYVRPLASTRYPDIKGLDVALFREQLAYLQRYYQFVSGQDVIAAVRAGAHCWSLPPNAVLLTFDDGYADHYEYVFPILDELGIPGCFFPPASAVLERRLLDANRIHFLLASVTDKRALVQELFDALDRRRPEFGLEPNRVLYDRLAQESRFDTRDVVFIKRVLQIGLPEALRARIAGELFAKYVSADENAFAEELYVDVQQLRCMTRHGMYVGSHGDGHVWMSQLDSEAQSRDMVRSLELLRLVGTSTKDWIISYPYGDSNVSLRALLCQQGCVVGLTTKVDVASGAGDPLLLPRLDTNDFPKSANASADAWTKKLLSQL